MSAMLFNREMPNEAREKMLYAALRLFSSKGYKDTSVLDIVEEAHVSKTTFYQFFSSKEALLVQLCEVLIHDITEEIKKVVREEPRVGYKAYEGIRRYLEICFTEHHVADLILLESVGISRGVEKVRQDAMSRLADLIYGYAREQMKNRASEGEIKVLSQAMVGAINEVTVRNFRNYSGKKEEINRLARLLNRFVIGAFSQLFNTGKEGGISFDFV